MQSTPTEQGLYNFKEMSTEVSHLSNPVAVRDANDIASLRAEVQREFKQMRTEVKETFEKLGAETREIAKRLTANMDRTEALIDINEFNRSARIYNSGTNRPESKLRPLKNTTTGKTINLPTTRLMLKETPDDRVLHFLEELGLTPDPESDEYGRKRQLEKYMGIP